MGEERVAPKAELITVLVHGTLLLLFRLFCYPHIPPSLPSPAQAKPFQQIWNVPSCLQTSL